MGKLSRRIARRAEQRNPLRHVSGYGQSRRFDLNKTLATDIDSIELDSTENTITVTIQVPVGADEGYAVYEEVIDLDEDHVPGYLHGACNALAAAVLRAVKERVLSSRTVPCATCTGACCGRQFASLRVTAADVERLQAGGVDTAAHVTIWKHAAFSGYVGELNQVPYKQTDELACPFLSDEGCTIYEVRPSICREYSAWTCDIYEEDPDKASGKVKLRLPVVPRLVEAEHG